MCFRPPAAAKKENKCPNCGTINLPDATVCANCGAELPKTPPGANPATPPPPGAPGGATPPKAPPTPPAPPKKPGE